MGLKLINFIFFSNSRHKLKSDQNGIEIRVTTHRDPCPIWLKSDQNGIEIWVGFIWCVVCDLR